MGADQLEVIIRHGWVIISTSGWLTRSAPTKCYADQSSNIGHQFCTVLFATLGQTWCLRGWAELSHNRESLFLSLSALCLRITKSSKGTNIIFRNKMVNVHTVVLNPIFAYKTLFNNPRNTNANTQFKLSSNVFVSTYFFNWFYEREKMKYF